MKKALDILKDVLINMDFLDDDGYHFGKYATMEAIAELEEAMKHKTCKGCIREAEDIQDPHCAFCSRACKDNFEPKDRA